MGGSRPLVLDLSFTSLTFRSLSGQGAAFVPPSPLFKFTAVSKKPTADFNYSAAAFSAFAAFSAAYCSLMSSSFA